MLVQNVVADPDMYSHRNRASPGRREHTQVAMGKIALLDAAPHVFPKPVALARCFGDPLVQLSKLAPQSELTGLDILLHAFRSRADSSQLVIVNRARAIDGDVLE